MRYRQGFHDISEEEITNNEKYLRIRETIKAEELADMFKKEAQTKLDKYNELFELIGKIEGEGFFSNLKTKMSIDQLKELTIKFWDKISPECKKEVEDIFNETNPNVQLVICKENEKFIADHCKFIIKEGRLHIPEDVLEKIKIDNPELYNEIIEINKGKTITQINVSLTGSLHDLYNLVHETTHYFTFRDTATERIFSEVAPQCMERALDDFLLQLSDEELDKYNFKKEELRDDIRKRRIVSFASRYKAAQDFIEKNRNNESEKEEEFLKYFLAQFFQAQFRKYNNKDRNKKIIEFIEHVKNDDFEKATQTFKIDWSNKLKRIFYIYDIIGDIRKDLEVKSKDDIKNKENQKEEKEHEEK